VTLVAGYLLKAQCTTSSGWDGRQYERLCYNDIQALYEPREVEERFPYVEGRLDGRDLVQGAIEYPVLTGTFMWVAARFASDFNGYLHASAILLAPFGLLIAYLLARMSGARALLWAAAPAVVLYAFHNWDLLVVAAATGGIYLWHRDRPAGAAVVFGIGGALKLFPLFLLLPMCLEVLMRRGVKDAGRVMAAGVGTFAAINLPFVIASPSGWWTTYEFHGLRTGNFDSIWYLGWPSAAPETINLITAALVATFFVGATAYGWVRARREGVFPFLQVGAALGPALLRATRGKARVVVRLHGGRPDGLRRRVPLVLRLPLSQPGLHAREEDDDRRGLGPSGFARPPRPRLPEGPVLSRVRWSSRRGAAGIGPTDRVNVTPLP
jgi:hypothetical protein